ncbi:hypothetical protein ACWC5I_46660, partial [Kitasatospora sp. NPDC001574]
CGSGAFLRWTVTGRAFGAKGGGGKGGGRARNTVEARGAGCVGVFVALVFSVLAWVFTDALWPGSTDVSAVPAPYDTYFQVLYLFEWGSFGLGVVWLLAGPGALVELGRPFWLSVATYLSVFWLLASWWPQDNMYRTSAKADWSRQSLLVYVFNVALMVSAAVVVRFMLWDPPAPVRDKRRGRR